MPRSETLSAFFFKTSLRGYAVKWIKFTHLLFFIQFIISLLFQTTVQAGPAGGKELKKMETTDTIELLMPKTRGELSLEETLQGRESVRGFTPETLSAGEISQLLWAAQGETRSWGGRTAPSAGALYPLEIYIALHDGVYRYRPRDNRLKKITDRQVKDELTKAALGQDSIFQAPVVVVIAAVYGRTEAKYGSRARRYVHIEVGHAAQNILLQAVALGLGAVPIGAFHDDEVKKILELPPGHEPVYIIAVGHRAGETKK